MPDFRLGPGEHVLVVGQNQTGKSTLARALTAGYRNQVVIDSKWEESLARSTTIYDLPGFVQTWPQRSTRVVFRPDPEALRSPDVDAVIRRVLRFGRTALIVHDVMLYATAEWCLPALRRALIAGASSDVRVWALTQRPIGLHNVVLSESRHVFVFDLFLEGDRHKVAGIVGPGALERPGRPFGFGYYGPLTGGALVRCDPLEVGNDGPTDTRESGDRHRHGDGRHLRGQGSDRGVPNPRPVRPGARRLAAR